MARAAKTTTTTKSAVRGRKPGRPASVAATTPAKVTKLAVAPKRAAKAATARIAELEEYVVKLAKKAALQTPSLNGEQAAKPTRAKRQSRGVDRDPAAPAGIAEQKPAPLDEEGEAALEEQLGHN